METVQILVNVICPTSTQAWIKRGALLVDVREKEEVAQLAFNVPNIVNIPLSEFEERYSELPKDQEMVLASYNGDSSLRATGFLINNGYNAEKVVNMKHGMIRWVQRGFPTTGDTSIVGDISTHSGCCSASTSNEKKHSCCGSHNHQH